MTRFVKTCRWTVLALAIWAAVSAAAESPASQVSVQKLLDAIRNIQTGNGLTPQQEQNNKKFSTQALSHLDVDELSRKALGKYWSKLSPQEQKQFTQLLGQLFVKVAFPNSAKFFADLKLVYGETRNKKSKAVVPLTVIHKKEGEISIDFHLQQNKGQWKVVDVYLDGISMRNNLKSQFQRILAKKAYSELVRRMENKLKESES